MVFRTISSALLAGVLAGLSLFLIQRSSTLPLIHAAETYEKADSIESASDAFATEPVRSLATLLGDIFVATAFGLILTGCYAISARDGWFHGLLCGLVGFATFYLAPALVVPPAVPGMEVAPLTVRQIAWWTVAVSAAVGFLLVFRLTGLAKLVGILFFFVPATVLRLLLPLTAPTAQWDPLALLDRVFVLRTLAGMLVFWLILGTISGYVFARAGRKPTSQGHRMMKRAIRTNR